MAQQNTKVREIIDMHRRGELQLPAIQRGYVWRAPRVRDLLDSLYRGYPSGTILVWETDEPVSTRSFAVGQENTAFVGRKLLLDGQQRVTSLAAVLNGKLVDVRGRKRPIDILFNLDHPEEVIDLLEIEDDEQSTLEEEDVDTEADEDDRLQERLNRLTFVVASGRLAAQRNWVRLTDVFGGKPDAQILRDAGLTSFDDPRFQTYSDRLARLRKILDYEYVMHVLEREMSYEEVTEIFVRVNSLGAKLRGSDLALAQISCRWQDVLSDITSFQDECERQFFTLDTGLLVRNMVVFATQQSRFRTVGRTSIDDLKSGWREAQDGMRFAINFLVNNVGIEDESLLTAPVLMIPIGVFSRLQGNRLSAEDTKALHRWVLLANVRGRYSRGSTESLLDQDLKSLFDGGGPNQILENLRQQVGRLEVSAEDFVGRGIKSGLFSASFLALKKGGAQDWYSGLGLSLTHQGRMHFIQYHHIFPKSVLKEAGYETAEINEIANLAFIGGQTNRRISNKRPEQYFPEIVAKRGEAALAAQAIPLGRELWRVERYRDFLAVRRQALTERINSMAGL